MPSLTLIGLVILMIEAPKCIHCLSWHQFDLIELQKVAFMSSKMHTSSLTWSCISIIWCAHWSKFRVLEGHICAYLFPYKQLWYWCIQNLWTVRNFLLVNINFLTHLICCTSFLESWKKKNSYKHLLCCLPENERGKQKHFLYMVTLFYWLLENETRKKNAVWSSYFILENCFNVRLLGEQWCLILIAWCPPLIIIL